MTHGMEFCSNWILFRRGCLFQMELAEKYDNLIWPILAVIYVCCSPHKLTFWPLSSFSLSNKLTSQIHRFVGLSW